jgi:hypothetical protein
MKTNDILDVLALANEVNNDSATGVLTEELLKDGQVLFGINPEFPKLLEQIAPDRRVSLGQFTQGQFHPQFCMLDKFN